MGILRSETTIGRNPTQSGQASTIPFVTTHDGRTVRFADPLWKVNDRLRFDIATDKVTAHYSFQVSALPLPLDPVPISSVVCRLCPVCLAATRLLTGAPCFLRFSHLTSCLLTPQSRLHPSVSALPVA